MAGRRKAYRMTPRRRAALRKAQLVSARKRRRQHVVNAARFAGGAVATVGSAFVAYHTQDLIANPHKAVKYGKYAGKKIRGLSVKPAPKPVATDWSKFGYL